MTELPTPLHCLTIQHIIDDASALDGYLSQYHDADKCIPLAIRDVFFINENNGKYGLENLNKIPDAKTTLLYLYALLGCDGAIRLHSAVKHNLIYLLPYILSKGDLSVHELSGALINAVHGGQIGLVRILRQAGAALWYEYPTIRGKTSASVLSAAIHSHQLDILLYLLRGQDDETLDGVITEIAEFGDREMLHAVLNAFSDHKLDHIDFMALAYCARDSSIVDWLEEQDKIHRNQI